MSRLELKNWHIITVSVYGQFFNHICLQALPQMTIDFHAAENHMLLMGVLFYAFYAVGQLAFGSASARVGPYNSLWMGLLLCGIGCIVCAQAQNIGWLLVGRSMQAFGAAAGPVSATVLAFSKFSDPQSIFARTSQVYALLPTFSPVVGGALQELVGWRAIFLFCFFVTIGFSVYFKTLTRSHRDEYVSCRAGSTKRFVAFRSYTFVVYSAVVSLLMAGTAAFFYGAPFIIVEQSGGGPALYGFFIIPATVCYFCGAQLSRKTPIGKEHRRSVVALLVSLSGSIVILMSIAFLELRAYGVAVGFGIFALGAALLQPLARNIALRDFSQGRDSATGLFGALQMGGYVGGTLLMVGSQPSIGTLAVPIVMVATSAMAVVWFTIAQQSWRRSHG